MIIFFHLPYCLSEDVLRREKDKLSLSNKQIDIILDNLCALGEFQEIHCLWRPYLKDPKDDHVLEVAVGYLNL